MAVLTDSVLLPDADFRDVAFDAADTVFTESCAAAVCGFRSAPIGKVGGASGIVMLIGLMPPNLVFAIVTVPPIFPVTESARAGS